MSNCGLLSIAKYGLQQCTYMLHVDKLRSRITLMLFITKITFIRLHITLSAPTQVVHTSASVGLCLVYSTLPGLREGSFSASPLGRYAAAASQSQETQTQTGSHIHLMCVGGR